jgi:hypothetical protein
LDLQASIRSTMEGEIPSPQFIADALLDHAMRLEQDRPSDDISVVVLKVTSLAGDDVRRMTVRLPIRPGGRA